MNIADLATQVYHNEFDSTGVSQTTISGWFENNLGMLNTYLYTSFSGANGQINGFGLEEADIYKEMYLYHHYTKQARNTLRGIATDTNGNILSVRDGDNSITFVNKNEVTKVYKSLANDSYDKMLRMIQSYNSYNASPRQVGGIESVINPTGS